MKDQTIFNILTFTNTNETNLQQFYQKLKDAIDFNHNLINLTKLKHGLQNDLVNHLRPEYLVIDPIPFQNHPKKLVNKSKQSITLQVWTYYLPFDDQILKTLVNLNQLEVATVAYYNNNTYEYGIIKTNGEQVLEKTDVFSNEVELGTFLKAINQLESSLKFKSKWKFWKR